jgi:hypothetical protein
VGAAERAALPDHPAHAGIPLAPRSAPRITQFDITLNTATTMRTFLVGILSAVGPQFATHGVDLLFAIICSTLMGAGLMMAVAQDIKELMK